MRSRRFEPCRARARAFALGLTLACAAATAAPADAPAAAPTRNEVEAAAATVRADPNLPGTRTEKSLRFKHKDEKDDADFDFGWIGQFFTAVVQGARVLVWLVGALAIGWLIWRIRRFIKVRATSGPRRAAPLPSHVGALDIRPVSLPADVGAAAAALWRQERHRAALSLLYRGALSRLVHVRAVPIRAASTESECVALAAPVLLPASRSFFEQLVSAWQALAYGGRIPDSTVVLTLCADFDARLANAKQPEPAAPKGAAA